MNDWDLVMHDADADAEPLPVPRGLAAALVCGVVFLVLVLAALVIWLTTPVHAQVHVPLASEADRVLAPMVISPDGKTVTFRDVAPDRLEICVNPSRERFGPRTCFSVGDVRRGRLVRR